MPTVKGNLLFVSSRVAQVSEVWVRAPKVRTHAEGLVTTGNDHFPVIDGQVEFTAVPGPAVLALISQGRAVDTVPIVVGDAETQTLRQVVNAAEIADDATKREIEKLAAQAVHLVDSSTENARKAQDGAQRAETAAGEAKSSAASAEDAASRASSSASSANRTSIWVSQAKQSVEESEASAKEAAQTAATQASSAEDSASAAKDSASSAAASESGAKESASAAESSATAASSSASKAAESEQTAGKFATQAESAANRSESSADAAASSESSAAGSAEEAKSHADRAANVADSTSWEGDRLTVNGQTSPPLTGPKGDPSDVTKDQLDTAIASEKARTVGMVWMVETEDQAQTKETSCQKGDFIQVAETGNIYQVV
ncbi:MAG: hypothetical protein E7K46_00150 [Corynebacterium sp.]|nr:hypothetical protein [Corynebacterium sp.]